MLSSTVQRLPRGRLVGCIILSLIIWFLLFTGKTRIIAKGLFREKSLPLEFLRRANQEFSLDLTPKIKYSQRCIKPVYSPQTRRQEVEHIPETLILEEVTIELNHTTQILSPCVPVKLTVPLPYTVQIFPNLIFGMATTYSRLRDSLPHISHWASGRGSKLVVIISDWEEQAVDDILKLQQTYQDRDIQASLIAPYNTSHSTSQSHFMVLAKMVMESGPETKWFGLLDDDAFFPHLEPLSNALEKLDDTADMYVGGLAEDFGSIKNFGLMAFGGAGAFLSRPLAEKLGSLDLANECIKESPPNLGDIILRNCVFHHTKAKLTVLQGLYQHDLLTDLRGFFESGVEPLSLHHWKSWYHEPVVAMAAATDFCGSCFLQRWTFGGDTVLSNGYSISNYRNGLASIDLEKMERTWGQVYGDQDPEYDFTIGPLRDKVSDEYRKTFSLKGAEIKGRTLRQLYIHKSDGIHGELDEVIELVWG